jgi:hypothetical protein
VNVSNTRRFIDFGVGAGLVPAQAKASQKSGGREGRLYTAIRMLGIHAAIPVLACLISTPLLAGDLKPQTLDAFHRYEFLTGARIAQQVSDPRVFLYINTLPPTERSRVYASLKSGGIYIAPLTTLDASGEVIEAPHGLIHHWVGAVFIPGATMAGTLQIVQDYDRKQDDYPEVVRSRLLHRDGNHFQAYMRLQEHRVITVTLDAEFDVTYRAGDERHWFATSRSTRIRQVENAGKPGEHDLPEGEGEGFLWHLDSYWQYVEQDGGVYVELEAVSLTRDVPAGLGWMIKPFITSVPRESLESTLQSTRKAVLKKR